MADKKITKIELFAFALVFALLVLYFLPKFMLSDEKKQNAILKTNAAILTSNVLEKFASDKSGKPDIDAIVKKAIEELNVTNKNPIDKKREAFVQNEECVGCVTVQADKALKSVILTGYDKSMKTVVRTVISPPSFVTYERDDEEK